MNNIIELPISKEDYERYKSFHNKDPYHMKPFGFYVVDDDENFFIINHGSIDGYLYDNRLDKNISLEEFYERIKRGKLLGNRHLVLICCHGGTIHNSMPEKVTIMNKSVEEIRIAPPCLSSTLDGEFFISIEGVDSWYE